MMESSKIEQSISDNIKTLGFVMTCFMVFYHVGAVVNPNEANSQLSNDYMNQFFDNMVRLVMVHFFAVTGFLLFVNLDTHNYVNKIKRRIQSLLIPYVVWQIIALVIVSLKTRSLFCNLNGFIYFCFLFVRWPIDGPLWYVYAVFVLAVFSPCFLWVFKNRGISFLFFIGALIVAGFFPGGNAGKGAAALGKIANWGYVPNLLYYFPAFFLGAYWGYTYNKEKDYSIHTFLGVMLVVSFFLNMIQPGILELAAIVSVPFYGITMIRVRSAFKNLKVYKLTFLMYALHSPLIMLCKSLYETALWNLNLPTIIVNIMLRVLVLGTVIGFAYLVYFIAKSISPKMLMILTGGRG